jgi:hypothetical protein
MYRLRNMTDYSVKLQQVESEIKGLKNDADYMSLVQYQSQNN